MKVAHLINSMFTGGAENLIAESVPIFDSNNLPVDVILLNGTQTPFLNKLQQTHCTVIALSKGSVYNPLLIFKIIPLLKKYDLIHVHLFPALYWVALAKIISFSKVKLVFTEHSTTNRRMKSKFFIQADKVIYSIYSKIITISKDVDFAVKNKLKSHDSKFELIKNGINLNKIKAATNYSDGIFERKNLEKFIFQVSSFQFPKDQKTVIRSLLFLPNYIYLFLVGDGILKTECEEFVKSLQLQNRVYFLGIRMDVADLLKTADFVVLSSHYEGLSLASIEGMASGRPFIASDVPGLREVVYGAGLLFPDTDFKALASLISKLDLEPDFYNQTVQNCLIKAAEFDIKIMVQKEIELYKSVLS